MRKCQLAGGRLKVISPQTQNRSQTETVESDLVYFISQGAVANNSIGQK